MIKSDKSDYQSAPNKDSVLFDQATRLYVLICWPLRLTQSAQARTVDDIGLEKLMSL